MNRIFTIILATILSLGLFTASASASHVFHDVPESYTHAEAINFGYSNDILLGYLDGNFYPTRTVSTSQVARIADRIAGKEYDGRGSNHPAARWWVANEMYHALLYSAWPRDDVFTDVAGHHSLEAFTVLRDVCVFQGFPDGTFRPDEYITRGQMASVAHRAMTITRDTTC